jgi:hypothetical protein
MGWLLALLLPPVPTARGAPPLSEKSDRIHPRLLQLLDEYDRNGDAGLRRVSSAERIQLRESSAGALVPVIVEPRAGISARGIDRRRIEALGGRVDAVSDSFIRVLASPRDARRLADLPEVRVLRAPAIVRELGIGFGKIVSQSVTLTNAAILQQQGITGSGVKVAVIDEGFRGLASTIAAGELPPNTVTVDLTGNGIERGTSHGVAVAEQVVDMAPGVQLYCVKFFDEVDLENAAAYLRTNSIRIANFSISVLDRSYYDDTGPINAIINASHDTDGVFWSVASGNWADKHWRGPWSDSDGDGRLDFSPASNTLTLRPEANTAAGAVVQVLLNWNQWGNSVTDLDLYVMDKAGNTVGQSTNPQTGTQDPVESALFFNDPSRAPYQVVVVHAAGPLPPGLDITLISGLQNATFDKAVAVSSLTDPADAHGATAIGAISQSQYPSDAASPERYSSQGPTTDGRTKPDFCAPDATVTRTTGLIAGFAAFNSGQWHILGRDPGVYGRGTSFSAPVVAGAAALLLQQNPAMTAAQLTSTFSSQALKISIPAPNPLCGSGRLVASGTSIPPPPPAGSLERSFSFGGSGFLPVYGDWNGDGVATIGAFDPATATWYLRNEPGPGAPDVVFQFGPPGSIPVVGDWDGNGTTTIGVFVPGSAQWYLRNTNSSGAPDFAFQYGFPGVTPVVGDWKGDHRDTVGVYSPQTGQWLLRNELGGGAADMVFNFGYAGTQPVVGDWASLGRDGIGIFDPSSGTWLLRYSPTGGTPNVVQSSPDARGAVSISIPSSSPDLPGTAASALPPGAGAQVVRFDPRTGQWTQQYGLTSSSPFANFTYGGAGYVPVYGDWNGDGVATVGAFDPATATWYLRNTPGSGPAEVVFQFGVAGSIPVVGDWRGSGTTTVGVFVPGSAQWYLRNSNSAGAPDFMFHYGWPGVVPVVGDWTGNHVDTVGVYYPPTGQWFLRNSPGGGAPDLVFSYGYAGTLPLVGDWSATGRDGIGLYDPSSGLFWLRNTASSGSPDLTTSVGGGMTGGTAISWQP